MKNVLYKIAMLEPSPLINIIAIMTVLNGFL